MLALPLRHMVMASTLTRPADTTAYAQGDLIASSTTAGSIVVPSFSCPRDEVETVRVKAGRLQTNLTTGFATFQGHIDLWTTAPTFTNGDNGAYAVATGSAAWVGHMTTETPVSFQQMADGATMAVTPSAAYLDGYSTEGITWVRSPGGVLYWSMRELDSTGFTPIASQTFLLTLSIDVE